MRNSTQVSGRITVGGKLADQDLKTLKNLGFGSIVNLRTDAEIDGGLSPTTEHQVVSDLGLQYRHMPVSPDDISHRHLDRFRAELSDLREPIYVHCASGGRAGLFAMADRALAEKMTGEEALEKAAGLGLNCGGSAQQALLKDYLEHRNR
jgi:uncharacterized protein (TIGR01244 family)